MGRLIKSIFICDSLIFSFGCGMYAAIKIVGKDEYKEALTRRIYKILEDKNERY